MGGGEEQAPAPDMSAGEQPEGGSSDKPFNDVPFDAGVEADENTDPVKFIQQLSGKLGQSLRKYTETLGQADLELEKFAINSVVSASHTAEMDPNDKNDIIKKINSSGTKDSGDVDGDGVDDDFGDDMGGPAKSQDSEEEVADDSMEEGIQILPKDHKQVFKDAKLGVTENKNLVDKKKSSIFVENNLDMEDLITRNVIEALGNDTETPTIKPTTKPDVAPSKTPRRERPWNPTPNEDPNPKASR